MSAVVVPVLKVEQRARHTGAWIAACMECDWFPDKYFDESIAMGDGLEHNRVRHDGVGVEFRIDMAMDHAADHERFLARTLRWNWRWTVGAIATYSLVMALLGGPIIGGFFVLYGLMLHRQSERVGKWRQRLEDHAREMAQMRMMLKEADDGSES